MNIFFTLKGDYDNLSGEMPEFTPEQRCSIQSSNFNQPPGELLCYTLDYHDETVPDRFTMTFGVTTYVEPEPNDFASAPEATMEDDMLASHWEEEKPDILAEFTFDLSFDPTYTAAGEVIPVDKTFELDGQSLTVTEVEVYPTHTRVNIQGAAENDAWLESVEFYLENEDGESFKPISNGISATGDPNSPAMLSFRLESPYFARSRRLTLHITNVTWLDKGRERIRIDLADGTAEDLPEGVSLLSAEKRPSGWILTFQVRRIRENHSYSVFCSTFYDAEGNAYDMHSQASSGGGEEYFEEILPLPDYHGDEVWLKPVFTRRTDCDPVITIPIK